jgi:phosphoribosylformimino-5-aminoimidazole carboxamide ribotide isomerase
VDAGLGDLEQVKALGEVHRVVAGLETLAGPQELSRLLERLGGERLVFSLDLKEGQPMIDPTGGGGWRSSDSALGLALEAIERGVRTMIVLDLARVGVGLGTGTEELCAQIATQSNTRIIAGGGVRGPADLMRLRCLGIHGALIASALHDGRIKQKEIAEL